MLIRINSHSNHIQYSNYTNYLPDTQNTTWKIITRPNTRYISSYPPHFEWKMRKELTVPNDSFLCPLRGGNYKSARVRQRYGAEGDSNLNPKRWMVHTMSLPLCWNCIFYIPYIKKPATTYDIKKAVLMWNIFCEVVILLKNLISGWHRMSTYLSKGLLECCRFRFSWRDFPLIPQSILGRDVVLWIY